MHAVKPFPDADLYQFIDRKLQGSKGKQTQERLKSNIKGFYDALIDTFEDWKSVEGWPHLIHLLEILHISVDRYFSILFNQLLFNHSLVHKSNAPVRTPSEAITCKTVERHPSSLTVAKDLRPLNFRLIASHEYVPIHVNEYMEGLDSKAKCMLMDKVKVGLLAPFQLWSWKIGDSSGGSAHFLWKIPPKGNVVLRQEGESKAVVIIGELVGNQEMHYRRVVMTAYLGHVVHPDFIGSKAAARAVWQFITGDNVDSGNDACGIAALWALNSCDKGVIVDMRAMSGATKDACYDPFWKELEQQSNSYKTVHSWRHGKWHDNYLYLFYSHGCIDDLVCIPCSDTSSDRSFMPLAVFIRSMIDKVTKALDAKHASVAFESVGIKVPSESYVGMQFAPKNISTTKALAYTCM